MFKSILSSLPPINLKVNKMAVLIYAISIIIMLLIGAQRSNIPAYYFTRDVAALNGGKFYYGAISTIGMFLWCASAAVCIFSSIILSKFRSVAQARFLLFAGIISLFLMIDDQFMLHETVFPTYLGINEYVVLALYPILIFIYMGLYHREILTSQVLILVSALSLLGLSMVVDMFINIPTFIEDCFKFFGIVGWTVYQIHTSYQLVLNKIVETKGINVGYNVASMQL